MPATPNVKAALERGLTYLAQQQQSDGGFTSSSSPTIAPFKPVVDYQTIFVPALMLAALSSIPLPQARSISSRLAKFLLIQKSPSWSFNYWAKAAPEHDAQPYPDDLDDTFCALSGLFLHNQTLVDEAALVGAVKLLLATEALVGGPYRTWLVAAASPPVWRDVDLAVNSNIAYFLSLAGNALPNLTHYIDEAIVAGRLQSPYYPSAYPLVYYIARGYAGQHTELLLRMVRRLQAAATEPLDQALCLTAALHLGDTRDLDKTIAKLMVAQHTDGSWPAAAFCLDPARAKEVHYNGSAALTTAFVLEALQGYSQHVTDSKVVKNKTMRAGRQDSALQSAVLALAQDQCRSLGKDLRHTTLATLRSVVMSGNGLEIVALPERFNQSLAEPLVTTSDSLLATLGLANLYGWSAYTVYDDFLDEEGQPELLSGANFAMRGSLECFRQVLPDNQSFQAWVSRTFNSMDGANAWEVAHCRFSCAQGQFVLDKPLPDYGDLAKLAERSLGHTLTPLAVLAAKGFSTEATIFRQTQKALKHYLIARQLNDDAHDWQTDIQNGHVSYVVKRILTGLDIQSGTYAFDDLLPTMRRQFWHYTLNDICRDMQRQAKLSRQAIHASTSLKPTNVITKLLDGLEASITETRAAQTQALNFLKHYKQKAPAA